MALEIFEQYCKSPKTANDYTDALRRFCVSMGLDENKLAKVHAKEIQAKLIAYIMKLKAKGRSYASQNMAINAVKKFCDFQEPEIEVNFRKVYAVTSEDEKNHDDKPYTKEQITKMIEAADIRLKALILLFVSTGVRIGAIPGMKIKDLTKIEDKGLYKVEVYPESKKHHYYTFTTPESTQAIDAMIEQRRIAGEVMKPTAPLFRTAKGSNRGIKATYNVNKPVPVSLSALSQLMQRVVVKAGVRKLGKDFKIRHETAVNHGFRKYCNTMLVRAGIKPIVVELLIGHGVGLQRNYLRLTEEEVLDEYIKAVDLLTISEENGLQQQVAKLKTEVSDIETMKKSYLDIKLQLEKEKTERERLYALLYASGIIKPEQKA